MDTPQDLIKPVPPTPGGKSTSRGPTDIGRGGDAGAEFAEAMRSARESSRPEARETQAPDRKPREVPEDTAEEPIYASKDEGSATETSDSAAPQAGASQAGAAENAQAAGGAQTQAAANVTNPQPTQAVAASIQAPITPLVAANVVALVDTAGAATNTIQPTTRVATATAAEPASTAFSNHNLTAFAAPVDVAPEVVASGAATVATQRSDSAISSESTLSAATATPPLTAQTLVAPSNGVAPLNINSQAGAQALPSSTTAQAPTSTQATAVAIASAPVAMAVDRAIGNAIVNLPATGVFRPADLATQAPADPARIASTGFVAVALQPVATEAAAPALPVTGESLAATDAPEMSAWLSVRPDSLAMALAERALSQDGTLQLPIKLDQALQSLDQQLIGITGGGTTAVLQSQAQADAGEPLGAIAAMADAQANQAIPVPAAGTSADIAEPVSLSLNAPMQQASRWAAEFGDRLAWVANNRFNSATLQINPPQLGPIEVRILMSGDQAAVSFAAVQPQTREAIQQALPVLASSLASQGLSLGQTSVGRDHLPQQGGQGGSGNNPGSQSSLIAASTSNSATDAAGGATRGGNGLVDTFA